MFQSNDSKPVETWLEHLGTYASRYLLGFFVLYAVFGALTVGVYPSYSYPGGDEGTYLDYARHPWTLTSEFFEGFHPKEVQNPYNARLFLNPFSLLFSVFGFTYIGARLLCLAYGMVIIWLVYQLGSLLAVRSGNSIHASRGVALLVTVAFSMQPQLLFFTHGIRPEIMFTLFLLLCTWVLVRREDGPCVRTWGALGFLSSCMLLVHYNGVTAPLLFFAAALFHDRGAISWRKVLAFVYGGLAFVTVFILINFLPALDTVREFGVMPVTFVSSNKIPIAQSFDLIAPIKEAWHGYQSYWTPNGVFFTEPTTGRYSSLLLIPTAIVCWRGAHRGSLTVCLVVMLMVGLMVYVIPNQRQEYAFYLCPFFFVTGTLGLLRIRAGIARTASTLVLVAVLLFAYVQSNALEIRTFYNWHKTNVTTEETLRQLASGYGEGHQVTVMATQEFRVALPEARFRTFHSLLLTRSLGKTLDVFKPDIVVLHKRSIMWIGFISGMFDHLPKTDRFQAAGESAERSLLGKGYRKLQRPLSWDDSRVFVFARRR